MLQIQNLTYTIGNFTIIDDISWTIKPGKRIGLIGPNGAGKTTLFRIITGEYQPDSGNIQTPKDYRIGYLPQEEIVFDAKSLLDLVLEGHQELLDIEKEISSIHEQLDKQPGQETLIKKLGQLEDRFNLLGGYTIESSAKKVLTGLGFKEKDFDRSILEFSGGWRMRGHLARLLLQQPDLLLMDEPTNHLDLYSLEWLEEYLQSFKGSIVIISHDRFFLDRTILEIAELENRKLKTYTGNFHFYEEKKELEKEQLIKAYEAQKEERAHIQKFIDRFRYKNTKAAQVQSRVKMLEKMELIELPPEAVNFRFKIQADVKSFKEVLNIDNLEFGYSETPVISQLDLNIERGEKIALVGENGQGKTTLTKLIYGDLKPQQGTIKIGERVNIGYYAQHQIDALKINSTIFDEVNDTAAPSFRTRMRDILGLFGFHGDDVNKKIAVLSGGEKARVSLAKILLSPCNFLIMDEPTNHLDISSKNALEQALRDYEGTLLVISHDRYFLDRLVKRVIEIRNGKFFDYPGNYSYYLSKRQQYYNTNISVHEETTDKKPKENSQNAGFKSKDQKRLEAEARQEISKKRNRLKKLIDDSESNLEKLAKRKAELEQLLAEPETYNDPERVTLLNKEYKENESETTLQEQQWEKNQLLLEELLETIKTQ
ncbi:MAG: ATP-binding cassette domain-containing protein [Calditrichaeota bacterium]|nr:ATP-binding cassette domain-containing protein [Calditrichota bacterium]